MKSERDEVYLLHRRPFKESSVILEAFSKEHGWVSLVARGAKRSRSRFDALLQPFMRVECEWGGKGELKTLFKAEAITLLPILKNEKLIVGLYLNELMTRLLQRMEPHPFLFDKYHETLVGLSQMQNDSQQALLRQFELKLLAECGYGFDLDLDIKSDLLYSYDPKCGIYEISSISVQPECAVSGACLISLRDNTLESEGLLLEAKKLMRHVLGHYIGNKPLQTRKLFFPT